jgi:hypothetical protein
MPLDPNFWADTPPTPGMPGMPGEPQEEELGLLGKLAEIPLGAARGIGGFAESFGELGNILPGVEYDIPTNLGMGRSKTVAGGIVEGIFEFGTGFMPVLGILQKGANIGKALGGLQKIASRPGAGGFIARRGQEALAGGAADFMAMQGHEQRLSDLIKNHTSLESPILDC